MSLLQVRERQDDINYQKRLEEQIITRRQGPEESSVDYLTYMMGLDRLYPRPIPLEKQLDRIYRNMIICCIK